jgi:hypothetical protein
LWRGLWRRRRRRRRRKRVDDVEQDGNESVENAIRWKWNERFKKSFLW